MAWAAAYQSNQTPWRCVMNFPAYFPYYVIAGTGGMTAAIPLGLRGDVRNAGWSLKERATAFLVVALTFIGWLGLTSALAFNDVYRNVAGHLPTIQYGIFLPILICGFWIWRSPRLAR